MTKRRGFTLVELLIVISILSIMALLALPQFLSSTDDAKNSTLQRNLSLLQRAIEQYYHEHNNRYPGMYNHVTGNINTASAIATVSFKSQLLMYTNHAGKTTTSKTGQAIFGPYVKTGKLPKNPFFEGDEADTVKVFVNPHDISNPTITDGTTGWIFFARSGVLAPNHALNLEIPIL